MIAALYDEDKYVRAAAATSLGECGDTAAVAPLTAAMNDEHSIAATALGCLGDAAALPAQIAALPPIVLDGLVVVPAGLLTAITGRPLPEAAHPVDTQASATRARAIVMEVERSLGFTPVDREFEQLGYDIESLDPATGKLRILEVKGRVEDAETITVTKNEFLYSLNKPDDYILAMVEFAADGTHQVHYLRRPFGRAPDFGVTNVNDTFADILARSAALV